MWTWTSWFLLALQAVEGLVQGLIVPLVGDQLVVVVDDGESIDQMCAEEGVYILGHVFPSPRSVLGPVGEVAHHLRGSCWKPVKTKGQHCTLFITALL